MARIEVPMPQMGESIAEGTVSKWLKNVGDQVDRDEPILEISTDKVDAEIPSPAAGTLVEILAKEGDTVNVGAVTSWIITLRVQVDELPLASDTRRINTWVPIWATRIRRLRQPGDTPVVWKCVALPTSAMTKPPSPHWPAPSRQRTCDCCRLR